MPSRYSKKAPPAVETKLNLWTTFNLFNNETVSPPPITENYKSNKLFSVVGGGDTVSLLNRLKVVGKFNFVSTAGGAFLEYLEGKKLPGITALNWYVRT